jgi:hypothetical protein
LACEYWTACISAKNRITLTDSLSTLILPRSSGAEPRRQAAS